ncbi:MAG: hypothetical protein R8M38_02810 [Mariprofundaceae bacterium]
MKATAIEPKTGQEIHVEIDDVTPTFIEEMASFDMSDEGIKKMIDALDISADAKLLLYSFSKATIRIGEYVLKIGRKIIDFVCLLFQKYPNASFGMVFGAIAGFLVATIPILGAVLGPLVTPILIAFGMISGLKEDIKDMELARKISEINGAFSPLRTA